MTVYDDALVYDMQSRGFAVVNVEHEVDSTASCLVRWRALPAAEVIRQAERFLGKYDRVAHAT